MTILGQGGAEDLLGKGDMLVDCGQVSRHGFVRCQGCFLSDKEIKHICDFLAAQQPQCFDSNFLDLSDHEDDEVDEDEEYDEDEMQKYTIDDANKDRLTMERSFHGESFISEL